MKKYYCNECEWTGNLKDMRLYDLSDDRAIFKIYKCPDCISEIHNTHEFKNHEVKGDGYYINKDKYAEILELVKSKIPFEFHYDIQNRRMSVFWDNKQYKITMSHIYEDELNQLRFEIWFGNIVLFCHDVIEGGEEPPHNNDNNDMYDMDQISLKFYNHICKLAAEKNTNQILNNINSIIERN